MECQMTEKSAFHKAINSAAQRGSHMIEHLTETNKPLYEGEKTPLPDLIISQAAELLGCTPALIRQLDTKGEIQPPLRRVNRGKVQSRVLNYNDVNRVRELIKRTPRANTSTKAKRISFANLKGGVAKSTHAIHLAHFLAIKGYKVLMIDADPQGTTTESFGIIPDLHLADTPNNDLKETLTKGPSNIIEAILPTYWDNIDLIPAQIGLQFTDWTLTRNLNGAAAEGLPPIPLRLNEAIKLVDDVYDVIIIDTPPNLGMLALNSISAADYLIVPITPHMADVASGVKFFKILSSVLDVFKEDVSPQKVQVLSTKVRLIEESSLNKGASSSYRLDSRDKASKELIQQMMICYGDMMMDARMGQTISIQKANSLSRSLYELASPKETERKAINMMDGVNSEILQNIQELWAIEDGTYNESQTDYAKQFSEAICKK